MFSPHAARLLIRSVLALGILLSLAGAIPSRPEPLWNYFRHGRRRAGRRPAWRRRHAHGPDISSRSADHHATPTACSSSRRCRPEPTASRSSLQSFNSWEATDIALRLGERRALSGIKLQHWHAHGNGVGDRPARNCPARFRRKERAPHVGADSERADGRTVNGRAAQTAARHDAHFQRDEQQSGIQRRDHRDQRQRRRRQAERGRQFFRQRHARRRARHRHRRRPRLRSGLQLRHVGEPQPGHGRRIQGAAVELRGRARQGPDYDRRGQQGGRAEFPRHGLCLHARLPAQLERVAAQQVQHRAGSREQAEEPVHLPRLQHRRAPADSRHRLQQEPGSRVLLHRIRVLSPEARYGNAAILGADAGHARRGLQQHVVIREPRQLAMSARCRPIS